MIGTYNNVIYYVGLCSVCFVILISLVIAGFAFIFLFDKVMNKILERINATENINYYVRHKEEILTAIREKKEKFEEEQKRYREMMNEMINEENTLKGDNNE